MIARTQQDHDSFSLGKSAEPGAPANARDCRAIKSMRCDNCEFCSRRPLETDWIVSNPDQQRHRGWLLKIDSTLRRHVGHFDDRSRMPFVPQVNEASRARCRPAGRSRSRSAQRLLSTARHSPFGQLDQCCMPSRPACKEVTIHAGTCHSAAGSAPVAPPRSSPAQLRCGCRRGARRDS